MEKLLRITNKPIDERANMYLRSCRISCKLLTTMARLRDAFAPAREAHAPQSAASEVNRISLHPIAVATIAADDMHLDVNPVTAASRNDVKTRS